MPCDLCHFPAPANRSKTPVSPPARYQQEDPGGRVPAPWRAAGPGVRGAGSPVGVDGERQCLPAGQDRAVAETEHPPAGRGQAGQPQSQ